MRFHTNTAGTTSSLRAATSRSTGCLILAAVSLISGTSAGQATPDPVYTDQRTGFSIEVPESMETQRVAESYVLLKLVTRSDGFPTFNVTEQPPGTAEKGREAIVESYRAVGLTDASLIPDSPLHCDNEANIPVPLTYTLRGIRYRALVSTVRTDVRDYILTFIGHDADSERDLATARILLCSFRLPGGAHLAEPPERFGAGRRLVIAALGLLLIGALLLLARFGSKQWRE